MTRADFAAALVELWPFMWRYAFHLCRNREEAADLRAETACRALERAAQYDPNRAPLISFVGAIMRSYYITQYNRRALWMEISDNLKRCSPSCYQADQAAKIDIDTIEAARRVEVAMFADGFSCAEISQAVGVCAATIRSRICADRRRLVKLLNN